MLYPLKFEPILKSRIWGGDKLQTIYHKKNSQDSLIGESWELSALEGDESVVVNGDLAGNTINELIEIYMDDLLGQKVFDRYGTHFPLLFKLIDANDKLSIQVHPSDELAEEKHDSFGKTEMWYVIDAEEGAELIVGFTEKLTEASFRKHIQAGTLESVLKREKVHAGDVFFIPAGLVHAIGKGILLAEIQQASDVTYRLYDYKRLDANGNERELHVEEAIQAIDFDMNSKVKVGYEQKINAVSPLVDSAYFIVNKINFDKSMSRDYSDLESFVVFMCVQGEFQIEYPDGLISVSQGETVLLPAEMEGVNLVAKTTVEILEVFIN